MIIPITPVPGWPKSGTQLRVDDVYVTLGGTANVQWVVLNEDDAITAGPARVVLTQEQYDGWVGPDEYVIECVAANLGLTARVSEEE